MRNLLGAFLFAALAAGGALGLAGCATETAESGGEDTFLLGTKNLLPPELVAQLPAEAVAVLDPSLVDTATKEVRPLVIPVGAPEKEPLAQPIQFPHNTHVQKLGMDCQYCHSSARKGANAGVPSTQLCMGCHAVVPTEGRPELTKLKEYWADGQGEPIQWAKLKREFQQGRTYRARVLRVADVLAGPVLGDETALRADSRVVTVVLGLPDQTNFRIGQRVLVRFQP